MSKTRASLQRLKLYVFVSSLAASIFLEILIVANALSIHYFLYAVPAIIDFDFLLPMGSELFWIGAFILAYIVTQITKENRTFKAIGRFINVGLVGSFLWLLSILLRLMVTMFAEPAIQASLAQISTVTFLTGCILSFVGSNLALISIMIRDKELTSLFLIYFFSLLLPIEIWSLAHWAVYPFNAPSSLAFAWQGAFIELQLFHIAYPIIFWLFIAFLFSWIWVPLLRLTLSRTRLHAKSSHDKSLTSGSKDSPQADKVKTSSYIEQIGSRNALGVIVVFLLVLGALVAYYPYFNVVTGLVGWDTLGYYLSLSRLTTSNTLGAFQLAAATDRPLFLLLLYFSQSLTQFHPYTVVIFAPTAIVMINALTTFWFLKAARSSLLGVCLGVAFSLFSFNTTVGMHAGILANWFVMALGFLMFGVTLRIHEKLSWKLLLLGILTWVAVFLVHYWSGVVFLLILGFYLLLNLIEPKGRAARLAVYAFLISSVVILLFFFSDLSLSLFPSYGAAENVSPGQTFVLFMAKLPVLIDLWFFGSLANPVMLILALVGILACYRNRTKFARLMISWVFVVSVLSLFVSPIGRNMDQWLLWRTLYLLPFQIPAAIGLSWIITRFRRLKTEETVIEAAHDQWRSRELHHRLARNGWFAGMLLLTMIYVTSAILLNLNFPFLVVLLGFNYLVLTIVFHTLFRKRDSKSIAVLLFVLLVMLMLLNYTLRSLAPLATNRMQI